MDSFSIFRLQERKPSSCLLETLFQIYFEIELNSRAHVLLCFKVKTYKSNVYPESNNTYVCLY